MSSEKLPEEGWFVALEDQLHGPVSASQAWHLLTNIQAETPVQIWHPSLPAWQPLPLAPAAAGPGAAAPPAIPAGAFPPPKLNLDDFRLGNARYIAWIACGAATAFILGAALARAFEDATVTAVVVAIIAYFGWWLYLEQAGVRLLKTEIVFPHRIALWPFPALRLKRLRIADISGFECWGSGPHVHWFRLHAAERSSLVVLDDALHREILVLALEQRLPRV